MVLVMKERPQPDQGTEFVEAEALIGADGIAMVALAQRLDPRPVDLHVALTADYETPALIAIGRYRLAFPGLAGRGERRLLTALSEKREMLLIEAQSGFEPRVTRLSLEFPEEVGRT